MIEEGFRRFLLSFPGVESIVRDRIHPEPLPQGSDLPAITFTDLPGEQPTYGNDGPDCTISTMLQIKHWAATRQAAQTLETMTRSVLDGYQGSWPSGLTVQAVFRRGTWTLYEPETSLYQTIVDYRIITLGE